MKRILFVLSVLVIASLACQMTGTPPLTQPTPFTQPQVAPQPQVQVDSAIVLPEEGSLEALYESVLPGVVAIRTDIAEGSGFMFDGDGHVVTNQHVVEGASTIEINFSSGFKAYGTAIGTDSYADIAVIKVDAPAEEIHPLRIGDSNALHVGQPVVAVGNPFGLNGTMTLGIISGLGRTQPAGQTSSGTSFSTADVIQTDAAINPGNSGGPLFNLNSEVIGINQSIRTSSVDQTTGNAVNSGVGFSISINLVKRIVPFLIRDGVYRYPYLGISSNSDLSLAEIEALGLPSYKGAYVVSVVEGGPADQAGLRGGSIPTSFNYLQAGGDLITAFDGQPVETYEEMLSYLLTTKSPGDTVVLTVLRDGQPMDITITLGERP